MAYELAGKKVKAATLGELIEEIDLIGNIVADAEVVTSKDGREQIAFRLAVNEKAGEESKATYFDVRMGKSGILSYLKKGSAIYVTGKLSLGAVAKDGKAYLNATVFARDVVLL